MKKKSSVAVQIVIFTVASSSLFSSFLSGKIIDIPYGTHRGGVIAATGVGIIMIFMVIVMAIFLN